MFLSLVQRNNKIYFRDKAQVFFSLLSVIIVLGLYILFLQKTQLDAIEAVVPLTTDIKVMVNEWMVSGLISIIAVTTTLGTFGTYVGDLESKKNVDFLTTAMPRTSIQFSYAISAMIIGFTLTLIAFIGSQIFLVVTGGSWLSFHDTLKVIGIIVLSVLLSSVLNLFIILFISSQTAYATASTIVGTLIGFLTGVYVPIGVLPGFVQKIIYFFPVSHTTVLLREVFMAESLNKVFPTAEAKKDYMLTYGVQYEINGTVIEPWISLLFIFGTILIVGLVSMIIFSRRNK